MAPCGRRLLAFTRYTGNDAHRPWHDPWHPNGSCEGLHDCGQLTPQYGSHCTAAERAICMRFLDMRVSRKAGAFRSIWANSWCEEVREMLYLMINNAA